MEAPPGGGPGPYRVRGAPAGLLGAPTGQRGPQLDPSGFQFVQRMTITDPMGPPP